MNIVQVTMSIPEKGASKSAHQMQWQAVDLVKEEIKALKVGGA